MTDVLTINCPVIIQLAWGPRRVSSRAAPGTKAYPDSLLASRKLWLDWIKSNIDRKTICIVVTEDGADHGADYVRLMTERKAEADRIAEKRKFAEERLPILQRMREEARARRDFTTADAIRAEIEAAGFVVADQKIGARKLGVG